MITQIMSIEKSRTLDPITAQQTKDQTQQAAWKSYADVVAKLQDSATALQAGTPFGAFQATAGVSATSGHSLVSATASSGAVPATYQVEVDDIARAEKLGGSNVGDVNAAMNLTGSVLVNGRQLSIAGTDSLSAIRDKINALNTGASASGVSASILTVSSGVSRLILTSNVTGSAGIELVENGGTSALVSLGLVSGSLVANTIDGSARSYAISDTTKPVAQVLATTMPAAGSFKVNGFRVDVDLSQDSLATVATKINAAAGANTAIVSSEVVNGKTVSRLIVSGTVTTNPDDGAPAEAVSTQNLQQLGFLRNDRSVAMQLVAPTDAKVKVDGIPITRSTNTISDALAGVTLNLQQAEIGTAVDVSVTRDNSAAVTALKDYASAYNAVVSFVNTNTAANGPLAFDSTMRGTLRQIKTSMFNTVVGLPNTTFVNAPLIGVSLDKTGKLTVDETKLNAALASNPEEVKALFATAGSSTLSTVQYMNATPATQAGTYTVAITQVATTPTATGSALVGTYGNAAVANAMTVTDSFSGKTTTIALADTDTVASIAGKLNVAFGTDGLRLGASVTGSQELQLTGTQYGSRSSFTVGFLLNGASAPSQLGFAATSVLGTDVAGTINGMPATGVGRLLTASASAFGDPPNPADGLAILYTGLTPPETANVTYVQGIGGMLANVMTSLARSGDGQIAVTQTNLQTAIDSLTKRAVDAQARLDQKHKSLTAQFTAMETALSRLQGQSAALTNQINALQQSKN